VHALGSSFPHGGQRWVDVYYLEWCANCLILILSYIDKDIKVNLRKNFISHKLKFIYTQHDAYRAPCRGHNRSVSCVVSVAGDFRGRPSRATCLVLLQSRLLALVGAEEDNFALHA